VPTGDPRGGVEDRRVSLGPGDRGPRMAWVPKSPAVFARLPSLLYVWVAWPPPLVTRPTRKVYCGGVSAFSSATPVVRLPIASYA
jgi:hypothetical protein